MQQGRTFELLKALPTTREQKWQSEFGGVHLLLVTKICQCLSETVLYSATLNTDCLCSGLLACMIVSANCPSTKDLMSLNADVFSCTFAFERKNEKLAYGHVYGNGCGQDG
jgi:hypothetical protein